MDVKITKEYSVVYEYGDKLRYNISIPLDFEPPSLGIYKLSIDPIISKNGKLLESPWTRNAYSFHDIKRNEHDNYWTQLSTALRVHSARYDIERSRRSSTSCYEFYWHSSTHDHITVKLVYNWTYLVPKSEFDDKIKNCNYI